MGESIQCDIAVLGGGPGGYTAAFRAADLGKRVVLIDKEEKIGGVCLNVGCIPSKTLLHVAETINTIAEAKAYGLNYTAPEINLDTLRAKKNQVIEKLTGGLASLARARNVRIARGTGRFTDARCIQVEHAGTVISVNFEQAIIAVGSAPVELPFLPNNDSRIWDSSDALALPFVPEHLAVLGGGIIGLEMAQVYAVLGSKITIIEMLDQLIASADADLLRPLSAKLERTCKGIHRSTKLTGVKAGKSSLKLSLEGEKVPKSITSDALLVSVGRRPNGQGIDAEKIGVKVDEKGFIPVNQRMETNLPGIYAIGDVVGNPMLAHKAAHEAKIAAEAICGLKSAFAAIAIPSVAYTDPEIAWCGYTEKQAKADGIPYKKGVFPWAASGRALSADKAIGHTKVLFNPETGRIIGAGVVGARAGDLIAEATLAIEMGADALDIGNTIHAHPTFAETLAFAAEMAEGTITDALPPKKK